MDGVSEDIWKKICHYCAYQDRCHSEVSSKLIALGCYGEELDHTIALLISENFLNEERYARSYARGKFKYKHWGRVKIKQNLKFKNVSESCIRKGLSEINEDDYIHSLKLIALKKYNSLKKELNLSIRKHKTYRYLIQMGYESDLIQEVIKEISA